MSAWFAVCTIGLHEKHWYPRRPGVAAKVLTARKPDATAIQATVDTLLQPRLATLANCN